MPDHCLNCGASDDRYCGCWADRVWLYREIVTDEWIWQQWVVE